MYVYRKQTQRKSFYYGSTTLSCDRPRERFLVEDILYISFFRFFILLGFWGSLLSPHFFLLKLDHSHDRPPNPEPRPRPPSGSLYTLLFCPLLDNLKTKTDKVLNSFFEYQGYRCPWVWCQVYGSLHLVLIFFDSFCPPLVDWNPSLKRRERMIWHFDHLMLFIETDDKRDHPSPSSPLYHFVSRLHSKTSKLFD